MKNSRLVFVALLAVLAASCSRGARVSGVLKDAPEAEVEVRLLDINRYRTLDTLKTDARGAFSYVAEVEKGQPEFFYLFYHGRRVASLLLQAGDRVEVVSDTLGNYSVTGSPETSKLIEVERAEAEFAGQFAASSARLDDLDPASEAAKKVRRDRAKQYITYYRDRVVYVMENSHSLTVVPVLYQVVGENLALFSQPTDAIHFRRACDSLRTVYPDSRYVKALDQEARRRENLLELDTRLRNTEPVGYPDLEMPDIQGRKVKVSDLDAKVIMIYFWSSADAEQSMFNLDVLKPLYDKYHDKGFEIYAVSLDTDKTAWATVVRNQKVGWINVCDGKGQASRALSLYQVPKFPTSYLIVDGDLSAGESVSDEASLRRFLDKTLK